ncbi:unnamed protein product [Haemonchus placei]|uniref:BLVR domain-containing protein n=1 Tax=Haemonchus placei TaxID=6290 RepID=A0A0N4WLF8_HAEPC|nr:unnamed protein product [Haemonchus placei]
MLENLAQKFVEVVGSSTFLPRRLRSEERMPLKDAIPILTPERKSDDRDEVHVSAELVKNGDSKRTRSKNPKSTDQETDDMSTSELFPAKKALRYNKNSGKYDDISY